MEHATGSEREALWAVRGISKSFPGVQALRSVSLDIRAGEVHALLGENGSGKSTLAKCLAGVHPPDAGQIFHRGAPVSFRNPAEARARGVATIYQEFSLVPTFTVAENVFLGNYRLSGSGRIDWKAMRAAAEEVLQRLSLSLDPEAVVKTLSVAGQQMVEIAKAISMDSSLLIMDEPTASLGLAETQHLMELIRRLTDQGKAVIYISHRLDEVFDVADRVTVLKDGQHVATAPISTLKMADVVRMMVGFDIERHYPKQRNVREETCLEVEGLSSDNGVSDVSFTVRVGEVLGLGGMVGSGRTELARAIYGLDRVTAGHVRLSGKEVRFRSPRAAIAHGVGLIPENRKVDGSFFNFDGPRNITIARIRDVVRAWVLRLSREAEVGRRYVKKLSISPSALEHSVRYLSGGNQQKVIIARWLFARARLLIMDEPTQGIDIGAKLDVYRVINELTAGGISVILISSDFAELLAMSDRVAVVRHGRILGIAPAGQMSEYELVTEASGAGAQASSAP